MISSDCLVVDDMHYASNILVVEVEQSARKNMDFGYSSDLLVIDDYMYIWIIPLDMINSLEAGQMARKIVERCLSGM